MRALPAWFSGAASLSTGDDAIPVGVPLLAVDDQWHPASPYPNHYILSVRNEVPLTDMTAGRLRRNLLFAPQLAEPHGKVRRELQSIRGPPSVSTWVEAPAPDNH